MNKIILITLLILAVLVSLIFTFGCFKVSSYWNKIEEEQLKHKNKK